MQLFGSQLEYKDLGATLKLADFIQLTENSLVFQTKRLTFELFSPKNSTTFAQDRYLVQDALLHVNGRPYKVLDSLTYISSTF